MTSEELQNIISKLEDNSSKENATFGIFQYGGGSDESFIRANREGLEFFALELLKAASRTSEILAHKEKNIIPIAYEEDWIDEDSDTLVQYIKPTEQRRVEKSNVKYKNTIAAILFQFGCLAAVVVIVVAAIVGFITLAKWIS